MGKTKKATGTGRGAQRQRAILAGIGAVLLASCGGADESEVTAQPAPLADAGEPVAVDEQGMAAGEDVVANETVTGPAYLGVWAIDPAACDQAPGGGDTAPIAITEGEFIGGTFCRVGRVEETGPMSWTIETFCEGGGVEYSQNHAVRVDDSVMTITTDDEPAKAYRQCRSV